MKPHKVRMRPRSIRWMCWWRNLVPSRHKVKKMKRKRENTAIWMIAAAIIVLFSAALSLFALWQLMEALDAYTGSERVYEEISEVVTLPDHEEYSTIAFPEIDWDALNEINPDIIGWLNCPDTPINYPVVQGGDCTCSSVSGNGRSKICMQRRIYLEVDYR